ncbi:transposase, partial [Bacillus thuringiensis]
MKVDEVIIFYNKIFYLLVNLYSEMIMLVMKFLKKKEKTGTARNTQRPNCKAQKREKEDREQKEQTKTEEGKEE